MISLFPHSLRKVVPEKFQFLSRNRLVCGTNVVSTFASIILLNRAICCVQMIAFYALGAHCFPLETCSCLVLQEVGSVLLSG